MAWLIAAGCCLLPSTAFASDPSGLVPILAIGFLIPSVPISLAITLRLYYVHKRKRLLWLFFPILTLVYVVCALLILATF